MNLLIYMYYNSQAAAWNPADYGGIDTIEVPRQTFWTPDIGKCNLAFFSGIKNQDLFLRSIPST